MKPIDLEETLRASFMSQMAGLYFCIPCVIINTAQLAQQRVDVQPVINKRFKSERVEEHPPILAVPIIFPSSKTSAITFPVNVGDTVICVFSQRGMDTFKAGTGGFVTPTDFRKFDKRDAVAIPGLFPFSNAANSPSNRSLPHSTSDVVVAHNLGTGTEVELRLRPDGSVLLKSPTTVQVECAQAVVNCSASMTVTAPNTEWTGNMSFTGNWTLNGNLSQSGAYMLDGVSMNDHVHSGVQSGPSTTGGPQ